MAISLVLLPGMDGTGELFSYFRSHLPEGLDAKVISYPPSESLTYAQLLPRVLKALPTEGKFVILAESFSSPLGVMVAASHPPNLAGLVICAGFVTGPMRKYKFLARLLMRPLVFRVPIPDFFLNYFAIGRSAPNSVNREFRRVLRRVSPGVLAGRVREILDCDVSSYLKQIDVPMMYLQATEDRLVGPSCFAEISQLCRACSLSRLPGPHLILQRQPEICVTAVTNFVNQIEVS